MNRLNNGNTIQSFKPLRKKIDLTLILAFVMADIRADSSEDNNIVVYKMSRIRIFTEDWFHSLLPSIFMLAMAVTALCHLGWKMTFMVILFAPVPAIINKMRTANHEKNRKIFLIQLVNNYAALRAIHIIWLTKVPRTETKANSAKSIRNPKSAIRNLKYSVIIRRIILPSVRIDRKGSDPVQNQISAAE